MKVVCGGGGVNANGDRYELPTVERDIEDDAFETAVRAMWETCGTQPVAVIAGAYAHRVMWDFRRDG